MIFQAELNLAGGILTVSLTTFFSFIIWLLKRKRDFKRLFNGIKKKADAKPIEGIVKVDKKTFKLKYGFYKKIIKLLIRDIKEKYLKSVFTEGTVDYEKIVKDILEFINGKPEKTEVK